MGSRRAFRDNCSRVPERPTLLVSTSHVRAFERGSVRRYNASASGASPGLKMWGGLQAEPLKEGLEAEPSVGCRGLTDLLPPPEKTHPIYMNPRNTMAKVEWTCPPVATPLLSVTSRCGRQENGLKIGWIFSFSRFIYSIVLRAVCAGAPSCC